MTSCHYCNTPDDGYFEEDAKGNVYCTDCCEFFYCVECNYPYRQYDLSEIPETCVNCAEYKEN